jgi:outer membrane protein assembly factor BamB
MTPTGTVVWTLKLPMNYPSDPQQIGPDKYLIADYSRPGGIYEFDREGHILYKYAPASGEGMLDHPSLAVLLPNGLIATNDDHRQRVVIIDPATSTIVWQYGQTDTAGIGPNQLNTPDGLDLLGPNNSSPEHPSAG